MFYKARPVPRALQEDLEKKYEEGIANGIWNSAELKRVWYSSSSSQKGITSRTEEAQDQSMWWLLRNSQQATQGSSTSTASSRGPVTQTRRWLRIYKDWSGWCVQPDQARVKKSKKTCCKHPHGSTTTEEITVWHQVSIWILSEDHGLAYARSPWSCSLLGWSTGQQRRMWTK